MAYLYKAGFLLISLLLLLPVEISTKRMDFKKGGDECTMRNSTIVEARTREFQDKLPPAVGSRGYWLNAERVGPRNYSSNTCSDCRQGGNCTKCVEALSTFYWQSDNTSFTKTTLFTSYDDDVPQFLNENFLIGQPSFVDDNGEPERCMESRRGGLNDIPCGKARALVCSDEKHPPAYVDGDASVIDETVIVPGDIIFLGNTTLTASGESSISIGGCVTFQGNITIDIQDDSASTIPLINSTDACEIDLDNVTLSRSDACFKEGINQVGQLIVLIGSACNEDEQNSGPLALVMILVVIVIVLVVVVAAVAIFVPKIRNIIYPYRLNNKTNSRIGTIVTIDTER